jgi:hypothetical protein
MSVSGNDSHTPDKLSQDSFDPSIYSMESFDPSSRIEEFDPSDNEDDNKSAYSSRDSWCSRRSGNYDLEKMRKNYETALKTLQENLQESTRENEKLREERDSLNSALTAAKVMIYHFTLIGGPANLAIDSAIRV